MDRNTVYLTTDSDLQFKIYHIYLSEIPVDFPWIFRVFL